MNPPAPCAVTLPAHQPPALTPPPAPLKLPASRRAVSRMPTRSMRRASCPKSQARCALAVEPRSSFACPRLALSPIQPCPSPLAYVPPGRSIESGGFPAGRCRRRNPAPSLRSPSPPPLRAQLPRRASRRAALRASAYATSAVLPQGRSPGVAGFSRARLRAWRSARSRRVPPRFARTAPRPASASAFASLTPPRDPPAPLPSHRAQRRSDPATVMPL